MKAYGKGLLIDVAALQKQAASTQDPTKGLLYTPAQCALKTAGGMSLRVCSALARALTAICGNGLVHKSQLAFVLGELQLQELLLGTFAVLYPKLRDEYQLE